MKWCDLKGCIDFCFSLIILFGFLPFLVIVAGLIKLEDAGSVFFVQERVGKNGKVFKMIKFRTMFEGGRIGAGPGSKPLSEKDSRITFVGCILRKTGIDEIPQFFNILKGEMALIGPRPLLLDQIKQFSTFQLKRLKVKPGVTGLVAVCGGYMLSWPQRIRLDVWYTRHVSFLLDASIFFKTIWLLLVGRRMYNAKGVSDDFLSQSTP